MAHSLNNSNLERFKRRVSEYSTHGSRRGFVDVELPIPPDQLNDAREEWLSLRHSLEILTEGAAILRKDLGLTKKASDYFCSGDEARHQRKKHWTEERHKKYEELARIGKMIQSTQTKLKVLNRRLRISAQPENDDEHTLVFPGGKEISFKITAHTYLKNVLFYQVCRSAFGKDFCAAVNEEVDKLLKQCRW